MTYNLLDYFKQCLESILKYTDIKKHKVQIIIFNHGSTDGTAEYLKQFEHLDYFKVHNCKENIKNELTFMTKNSTWYDTKYTMIIANDTIATQNYLENLLACIKSDDRIAWICPSMCNTSNNQGIPTSYETIEEMHEFAKAHNKSDPTKWVELSRLIPVFSMYNNVCRKAINHEDPSYYEFFFGDDDISRAYLRSGFRILVCKDTYIHHYPSMTVHKGNDVNERYYRMRKIFFEKHGYDAWTFQVGYQCFIDDIELKPDRVNKILFIEPAMGEAVASLRTHLHKSNIPMEMAQIHSVSTNKKYKLDIEGYSYRSNLVESYAQLSSLYPIETFDSIIVPDLLNSLEIVDYGKFLQDLQGCLKKGGKLYCVFKNYYYIGNIYELLGQKSFESVDEFNNTSGKATRLIEPINFVDVGRAAGYRHLSYTKFNEDSNILEEKYHKSDLIKLQETLGFAADDGMGDVQFFRVDLTK